MELPTPYFQDKLMYTTLCIFPTDCINEDPNSSGHSGSHGLFFTHTCLSIGCVSCWARLQFICLKISLAGFHINAVAAYRICMIHIYCQSFSIRITSTRGRMRWKWKRQRISLSIVAWWWCLIQVYFMLRTQEILKCDSIHSVWRYVWLTERIHIDLPWSIIVSGLSKLWLGGDGLLRSRRRHWTSVWKHSESQSATDPYRWLAGDLAEHEC